MWLKKLLALSSTLPSDNGQRIQGVRQHSHAYVFLKAMDRINSLQLIEGYNCVGREHDLICFCVFKACNVFEFSQLWLKSCWRSGVLSSGFEFSQLWLKACWRSGVNVWWHSCQHQRTRSRRLTHSIEHVDQDPPRRHHATRCRQCHLNATDVYTAEWTGTNGANCPGTATTS